MANPKQKYLNIPGNLLRYHGAIRRLSSFKERYTLFDIAHGRKFSKEDAIEEADYKIDMVRNTMDQQNIIMPEFWYESLHEEVVKGLIGIPLPIDEESFDIFVN